MSLRASDFSYSTVALKYVWTSWLWISSSIVWDLTLQPSSKLFMLLLSGSGFSFTRLLSLLVFHPFKLHSCLSPPSPHLSCIVPSQTSTFGACIILFNRKSGKDDWSRKILSSLFWPHLGEFFLLPPRIQKVPNSHRSQWFSGWTLLGRTALTPPPSWGMPCTYRNLSHPHPQRDLINFAQTKRCFLGFLMPLSVLTKAMQHQERWEKEPEFYQWNLGPERLAGRGFNQAVIGEKVRKSRIS